MITILTGSNSFEIRQALRVLVEGFDGLVERVDGSDLQLRNIPDLLMGSTLFNDKRLVIINDLAQNTAIWDKLPDWLSRLSDDIHIVLVDAKIDKRTSTYKQLKKVADIREFTTWGDHDQSTAEAWVVDHAKKLGLQLDKKLARHLVARVGLDQWHLASALEKLSLLDEVNAAVIDTVVEPNPSESVFQLFELALAGKREKLRNVLRTLELTEDPYKLFALLSSQVFQLAAIVTAGVSDTPTKDFGIHPYVVSKMSAHSKRVGKKDALRILSQFARADADLKSSRGEPWLLIERSLMEVAK